jgi:lysophospholipase L1-like esterase
MYRLLPFLFLGYLINEYNNYTSSKYLALGDSLAVGIGAFFGFGYTRLYYNWLVNSINYRHLSYHNLGVIGFTSKELLHAVTTNSIYRNAILSASIITIDIGGNDILHHKYCPEHLHQALGCFRYNLFTTLNEIYCLNKNAQVYLMDIYNPYPIGHEMYQMAEAWVTEFNAVIWSTLRCHEFRISGIAKVYAAYKGFETSYTFINFNNIHPNRLGHKIINDCYKSITII